MRNLNECQAEVFRRSETRIKERRRRRNHILMTCMPLALCVSILAVFMLSGGKFTESEITGAAGVPPQNDSAYCYVSKVEVSGQGKTKVFTDPEVVTSIYTQLLDYDGIREENILNSESKTEITPEEEKYGAAFVTGSLSGASGYRIVITLADGSEISYDWKGMVLTAQNPNRSYTLTKDQQKQLTELLGIPN